MINKQLEQKLVNQFNGNKDHDLNVTLEEIESLKKDPLKRVIYNDIATLIFTKYEDIDIDEVVDLFGKDLSTCDVTLAKATVSFGKKEFDKTEEILLDLITNEENRKVFINDHTTQYFGFREPTEQFIYVNLNNIKKKVKLINENYILMYKLMGEVQLIKKNFDKANLYFDKALKVNPMDLDTKFEKCEIFKLRHEFEAYEKANKELLDEAYKPGYIARAYRNLAFCYEEKSMFDVAFACLMVSLRFERGNIDKDLRFIEAMTKTKLQPINFNDISRLFDENSIMLAPSNKIVTILYGTAEKLKMTNKPLATILLKQIFALNQDPKIDAEIKELSKPVTLTVKEYSEEELENGHLYDDLMKAVKEKDPNGLNNIFSYLIACKLTLCSNFVANDDPSNPYKVVPALIKDKNGTLLMPAFTKEENIAPEFGDKYQRIVTSMDEVVRLVSKNKDIKGIVVNPYSPNGFVITQNYYPVLEKMSQIKKEKNQKLN